MIENRLLIWAIIRSVRLIEWVIYHNRRTKLESGASVKGDCPKLPSGRVSLESDLLFLGRHERPPPDTKQGFVAPMERATANVNDSPNKPGGP